MSDPTPASPAVVSIDPGQIDAVVFDMGGVFLIPHPEPIGILLEGLGLEAVHADDLVRRAHYAGVRALTEGLAHRSIVESDLDIWAMYDHAYFSTLGVVEDRLEEVSAARNRQRIERSVQVWSYRLPENIAAFHQLAASTLPVAIVSNNDGTAEAQLVEHGICQLGPGELPEVVAVVDSTVAGVAKPDPAIFEPALDALADRGVAPGRALYVGDTVHADVRGATAAGMPVVQLDPYDLHDDHDHARLPDVVALAELLL